MTIRTVTQGDVADVLDRAAAVLEQHGWRQGDFWADADDNKPWGRGPCCAWGALKVAAEHDGTTPVYPTFGAPSLADAAGVAVEHHLGDDHSAWVLSEWNDQRGRTATEVLEAFRDTATELRAEAGAA